MTSLLAQPCALLLVAAGLNLTGCTPEVKYPVMNVVGVSFSDLEMQLSPAEPDLKMALKVEATNPSSSDLQIRSVQGKLTLDDLPQLPVRIRPELWLRSGRTTEFTIPFSVTTKAALKLASRSADSPCVAYQFDGSIDLTVGETEQVRHDGHPFSQKGCIPRRMLQEALQP